MSKTEKLKNGGLDQYGKV